MTRQQSSKYLVLFLGFMLIVGCGKDEGGIAVNLDEFNSINQPFPYDQLQPAMMVNYLELVLYWDYDEGGLRNEVIQFFSGRKCSDATDMAGCMTTFDELRTFDGFGNECLPANCYYYLKYQAGDEMGMVTNTNEIKGFLGIIDSPSDAILLVASDDYRFSTSDKAIGAYKESGSGYQLLVTKTVSFCDPVQTNRFLLEVSTQGRISILQQEVLRKENGVCI